MKLRILGWRDYPGLHGWDLNATTFILHKRDAEGHFTHRRGRGSVISDAETGEMQPQPRKAGCLQKMEEARNKSSPRVSGVGMGKLMT